MQLQPKPELRFKYPLREKFIAAYGSEAPQAIREFCKSNKAIAYKTAKNHMLIVMGESTEVKESTLQQYAQFLGIPVQVLTGEYQKYLATQNNRAV